MLPKLTYFSLIIVILLFAFVKQWWQGECGVTMLIIVFVVL